MKGKTRCPVCGSMEIVEEGKDMCIRCFWYLSPNIKGIDYGNFMTKEHVFSDECRMMEIRPRGFWSDAIKIHEDINIFRKNDWEEKISIHLNWSSGGTDGTLDDIKCALNFADALKHAIVIAETWKNERERREIENEN